MMIHGTKKARSKAGFLPSDKDNLENEVRSINVRRIHTQQSQRVTTDGQNNIQTALGNANSSKAVGAGTGNIQTINTDRLKIGHDVTGFAFVLVFVLGWWGLVLFGVGGVFGLGGWVVLLPVSAAAMARSGSSARVTWFSPMA